jgi:hypothetical protein
LAVIKNSKVHETDLNNKISPFTEEAPQINVHSKQAVSERSCRSAATHPLTAEVN